jgi:hypothetical protein
MQSEVRGRLHGQKSRLEPKLKPCGAYFLRYDLRKNKKPKTPIVMQWEN